MCYFVEILIHHKDLFLCCFWKMLTFSYFGKLLAGVELLLSLLRHECELQRKSKW